MVAGIPTEVITKRQMKKSSVIRRMILSEKLLVLPVSRMTITILSTTDTFHLHPIQTVKVIQPPLDGEVCPPLLYRLSGMKTMESIAGMKAVATLVPHIRTPQLLNLMHTHTRLRP